MRAALIAAVVLLVATQVGCSGGKGDDSSAPGPVDSARSGFRAAPAQAVADGATAVTLTVTARDANGTALAGKVAVFAVTGTANQLSATTATTDASGVATVTLSSTKAEAKAASVEVDGVAVAEHAAVTFTPGAPSLSATAVAAAPSAITTGGPGTTVTITVVDDQGNPITGVVVTLSSSQAGDSIVQPQATGADGVATGTLAGTAAGSRTVTAWIAGSPVLATATVLVAAAGPSAAASTFTGPGSSVVADGSAQAIFTLHLADPYGNPVSSEAVTFGTTGGTLSATSATTGTDGSAAVALTSTAAGGATVTATFGSELLQATATFVAGPPAALVFDAQPASGTAGATLAVTQVSARDAHGNVTAPPGNVTLSLASAPAGAVLPGTTTAAPSGNAATFADLSVQKSGSYTLRATSGTLQVECVPFTVAPAAAAALAFTAGPPSSVAAGASFGATVEVRDAYGNLVPSTAAMSLSLAPSGTLHGTATVPASGGVASFTGLSVNEAAPGYALAASSSGLSSATSSSFSVTPADPAALAFRVQPTNAVAGASISPAVEVAVQDAYGNLVIAGTTSVSLALQGGTTGAALSGGGATSTVNGTAVFAGLSVNKAGTGYALVATDPTLRAYSQAFDIAAGAPDASTSDVAASPTTLAAGGTCQITVTVRDAYGNPVPSVTVTLEASGAASTLTQPAATGADGTATGSITATLAGARTITGRLPGGIAITTTATVTFIAGPASAAYSTLVASPTSAPDDGTPVSLTATVKDAYGNPISGATVTLSSTGTATFTQPGPTDASGVATGSVKSHVLGTQTITATSGSTAVATADVSFTAAPPSASLSTVAVDQSFVPADGTTAANVTVTVRDTANRVMSGQTVALAYSGTASIAPASAATDASGVATFQVTASAVTSGNVTATVNPGSGQVVLTASPALAFVALVDGQVCTVAAQCSSNACVDQVCCGADATDPSHRPASCALGDTKLFCHGCAEAATIGTCEPIAVVPQSSDVAASDVGARASRSSFDSAPAGPFLVAWVDTRNRAKGEIFCSVVPITSAASAPVDLTSNVPLLAQAVMTAPVVSYSPATNDFPVIWIDGRDTSLSGSVLNVRQTLRLARIGTAGTPVTLAGGVYQRALLGSANRVIPSHAFALATTAGGVRAGDAYFSSSPTSTDVRFITFDLDGNNVTPPYVLEAIVSVSIGAVTAVAADPNGDGWAVAYRNDVGKIKLALLRQAASFPDGNAPVPAVAPFEIDQANTDSNVSVNFRPAVAGVSAAEYLVVWDKTVGSERRVFARRFDASNLSPIGTAPIQLTTAGTTQRRAQMSWLSTEFGLSYEDARGGIYFQRRYYDLSEVPSSEIPLAGGTTLSNSPQVLGLSTGYAVMYVNPAISGGTSDVMVSRTLSCSP